MIRSFARTRILKGPARADVELAMTKWWGKKRPAEGQVSGILCYLEASDTRAYVFTRKS